MTRVVFGVQRALGLINEATDHLLGLRDALQAAGYATAGTADDVARELSTVAQRTLSELHNAIRNEVEASKAEAASALTYFRSAGEWPNGLSTRATYQLRLQGLWREAPQTPTKEPAAWVLPRSGP